MRHQTVLISGASVAGPTLAYWLHRYGFRTTVVERTPTLRRGWGGHAVDLFGPAVEVAERMGILPRVLQARTRTELISFIRPGKAPVDVDFTRLVAGISDRHVEIMRGELAAILHDATRDDVEYVFGDGITQPHPASRQASTSPSNTARPPVRPRGRRGRAALHRAAAGLRRRVPVPPLHRRLPRRLHRPEPTCSCTGGC